MVESISIWTYYCTEEFLVEGCITALYHGVAYICTISGRWSKNDTLQHCGVYSTLVGSSMPEEMPS